MAVFSESAATDSSGFPSKRVSFDVMVPASGTRERHFTIDSFYPGAEIDLKVPTSAFTQGVMEQVEGFEGNDSGIAAHLANRHGETVLVVKGTAPNKVGEFSKMLRFRELIPGEPSPSKGIVELKLVGRVVPRWLVKEKLYAGFVSLEKDSGILSLTIERNPESAKLSKEVLNVSASFSEDWLSLTSERVSSDRIELNCEINEDKLEHLGAVQIAMDLKIQYADGGFESHSVDVFAHIDH